MKELSRLLAVFILVVAYFLFVENAFRAYNIGHREAAWFFLFGGSHSLVFWVGLVGLGVVVPALAPCSPQAPRTPSG